MKRFCVRDLLLWELYIINEASNSYPRHEDVQKNISKKKYRP